MAVDRKEILLWVGGTLASAAVAFLIYRLQQRDSAAAAVAASNAATDSANQAQQQQAYIASLPSVSVPSISSTPTTSDDISTATNNGGSTPATDYDLEDIIAAFQSGDQSGVTNTTTPIGSITALPYPTAPTIPTVVVPTLQNFGGSNNPQGGDPVASPVTATGSGFTNIVGANGYDTNLATPNG